MRVLDDQQAAVVRRVCEAIVPGCDRTGADVYVDALLARMPEEARSGVVGAFESLAEPSTPARTPCASASSRPSSGWYGRSPARRSTATSSPPASGAGSVGGDRLPLPTCRAA